MVVDVEEEGRSESDSGVEDDDDVEDTGADSAVGVEEGVSAHVDFTRPWLDPGEAMGNRTDLCEIPPDDSVGRGRTG